ncbi:MAG: hypothetical protein E7454_07365 [Ruminococcaceae bacterium]|nr:hypothetical protein [Oscillospiraceae bacterium]
MKKLTALFLVLTLLLGLVACSGTPENTENSLDIWQGVTGDTLELKVSGQDMVATLHKDGSVVLAGALEEDDYREAADFNERYQEYEAQLAYTNCYYGTYKAENGQIVLSCGAATFRRIIVKGKDAEAFKEAFIADKKAEDPSMDGKVDEVFDKGIVVSSDEGTQTIKGTLAGKELKLQSVQVHTKDGKLQSESVMRDDGSYTNTLYTDDGKEIREYNADNVCVQKTLYGSDDAIIYVEKTVSDEEGNSTTTRTDASGNVTYKQERLTEEYDGGKRVIQRRTENGVVTWSDIVDAEDDGLSIWTYYELSGETEINSVSVTGGVNDNEFSSHKVTNNGVLTEYQCHRYYAEGDVYYRQVTYVSDADVFAIRTQFRDGGENDAEIPAADYIHGEWERYS